MTRRTLALAGTLLLLALVAHAQPADPVRRIGVLLHDGAPPGLLEAFRGRLQELGYAGGTMITRHRGQILGLAATHALPVVSRSRDFAEAGGLIAYGPSLPGVYRRAADSVDRILRGARPSDLPIEEPTQFDLVVNLRTARALGLTIPPPVLLLATHLIR